MELTTLQDQPDGMELTTLQDQPDGMELTTLQDQPDGMELRSELTLVSCLAGKWTLIKV